MFFLFFNFIREKILCITQNKNKSNKSLYYVKKRIVDLEIPSQNKLFLPKNIFFFS
jgi:hypothetical protein